MSRRIANELAGSITLTRILPERCKRDCPSPFLSIMISHSLELRPLPSSSRRSTRRRRRGSGRGRGRGGFGKRGKGVQTTCTLFLSPFLFRGQFADSVIFGSISCIKQMIWSSSAKGDPQMFGPRFPSLLHGQFSSIQSSNFNMRVSNPQIMAYLDPKRLFESSKRQSLGPSLRIMTSDG